MAKRTYKPSGESYEAGQKRRAEERAARGFVYRTRPGRYQGDDATQASSAFGQMAAREQSGGDRFRGGSFSNAVAEGMRKRRARGG